MHDSQDEFFIVLDGSVLYDIKDADSVTLDRHQVYTVPKGLVHRTRVSHRTVMLMVEAAGVIPTGD